MTMFICGPSEWPLSAPYPLLAKSISWMLSTLARVTRACSWPSVIRKPLMSPRDAFWPSTVIFKPVKKFSSPLTLPWKNPVELLEPCATSRKSLTSRPLIGRFATCVEFSVVPVSVDSVSTVLAVPVTSTLCCEAATAILRVTRTTAPTFKMMVELFASAKPPELAFTV